MPDNQNENSLFGKLIVTLFAALTAWIWWVDRDLSKTLQWIEDHQIYHQLEQESCNEFRQHIEGRINSLNAECEKVEKRLNDKIKTGD